MENFMKVFLQISKTTEHLRKVFSEKWTDLGNEEWKNSEENGHQLNSLICKQGTKPFNRNRIKSGDLNRWDLPLLVDVIKACISWKHQSTTEEEMFLDGLVSVRNKISHLPNAENLSTKDCDNMCATIEAALKFYGFSESDLKNVKEASNVPFKKSNEESFNENNTKKALQMLQEAKKFITNLEPEKAINKISEALLISGLKRDDQCLLYTTRAEAYLQLEPPNIEKSLQDCTEAVTISPNNAQNHCQLALVHEKTEDFEKALKSFDIAVGLDPLDDSIKANRNNARFKKILQKYMLEVKLIRDVDDVVVGFIEAKREQKSSANIEKYRNQLLKGSGPLTLIMEGHNLRAAKEYQKAIQCYEKAIDKYPEAALNLAILKLFGRGIQQNLNEAITLVKSAAKEPYVIKRGIRPEPNYGVAEAGFILGLYYEEATREYLEAAKYYNKAYQNPENSCGIAGYRVGAMFYHGKGIPQDKKTGMDIWKGAATNLCCGYNLLALESIVKHYIVEEKNYEEAYIWYTIAKERGSKRLPDNQDEFRERMEELGTIQLHIKLSMLGVIEINGPRKNVPEVLETLNIKLNERIRDVIEDYFSHIEMIVKDEHSLGKTIAAPKDVTVESMYPTAQTKRFKQMAKRGNVFAERLLKTQTYFLSAMKIFLSADENPLDESLSIKFIQDYSNAIRLENFFIALPEHEKPKMLTFLNKQFAALTSCEGENNQMNLELEKDLRVCITFQMLHSGLDYDAVITFLTQCKTKFPKEEFFYDMLCNLHVLKRDPAEKAVKEANQGLEHFPTSASLLFKKAVAQANLEYLSKQTIINDYLQYLKYAVKGDRATPQVCYFLAILYDRVCKQEINEGRNGKEAYRLSKEYYHKAKESEKSVPVPLPEIAVKGQAESLFADHRLQRAAQFAQNSN